MTETLTHRGDAALEVLWATMTTACEAGEARQRHATDDERGEIAAVCFFLAVTCIQRMSATEAGSLRGIQIKEAALAEWDYDPLRLSIAEDVLRLREGMAA